MSKAVVAGLIAVAWLANPIAHAQAIPDVELPSWPVEARAAAVKLDFTQEPSLISSEPVNSSDPFAEGAWTWNIYGSGAFGDDAGQLYAAHIGVGYYFEENLSINLDGTLAFSDGNDHEDVIGGGLDLLFRWHFWRSDAWSLFLDGGAGMIVFDDEFPEHGTNLNFTPQAGVGFTYRCSPQCLIMGGAKWFHISNARIHGKENNPGYDAGMLFLGVMLPF